METDLLRVALRAGAIYLPDELTADEQPQITGPVLGVTDQLLKMGYAPTEQLLHALNGVPPTQLLQILDVVNEVMGTNLNWAPLVRGWDIPTGETYADRLVTLVANLWGEEAGFHGSRLPCGHLIPDGTFPLERYNGCPFCGRQFDTAGFVYRGQGSKLKPLRLWRDAELAAHLRQLLESAVPLNATQADSLKCLLRHLPLPEGITIKMKETNMLVIDALVEAGHDEQAGALLTSPTDVLRYLWYRHTGYTQLVKPRTLVNKARIAHTHHYAILDNSLQAAQDKKNALRLHYDRRWCRRVAGWLNRLEISPEKACEQMHPHRSMWVRFIRALRLVEYSRRPGYEGLNALLTTFHGQQYPVWQGRVDAGKLKRDATTTLSLLKQRPGTFARCLLSTMLWFGPDEVLTAFAQVAPALPPRLLLTLGSVAANYFDGEKRMVRPVAGNGKLVDSNRLLRLYTRLQLDNMASAVNDIYRQTMRRYWETQPPTGRTVYIDPRLDEVPVPVGDRSTTVHDAGSALQGTRFAVEGDSVRLFLQWGKGLPAMHLDMDLSAVITYDDHEDQCAYFNLTPVGAKHSGDIREIPDQVGTAEYVELNLPVLTQQGARFVVFSCNAYSNGELTPGLMVGWMDSRHRMAVDEKTGVAYDPSTVAQMIRIGNDSAKGLVFGVLDVAKRVIIWLEMPYGGQNVLALNTAGITALLKKLAAKPTVGQMLRAKAEAQHQTLTDSPDLADEAFSYQWALDTAAVASVLL